MVSHAKWSQPAHVGEWSLDVDSRGRPSEFILSRIDAEVARLPYRDADEAIADKISRRAGMPKGDAAQLVNQLSMKLASHKTTWEGARCQ
jgi:hypothetical protein